MSCFSLCLFTHKCLQPLLLTAIIALHRWPARSCCRVMHDAQQPRRQWLVTCRAGVPGPRSVTRGVAAQPRSCCRLPASARAGLPHGEDAPGPRPARADDAPARPAADERLVLDLARGNADDAAAAAMLPLFEKTGRGLRASPTRLQASPDLLTLHGEVAWCWGPGEGQGWS